MSRDRPQQRCPRPRRGHRHTRVTTVRRAAPRTQRVDLAPHSFFSIASTDPPIVQFTSIGREDSLRNVEDTGEFVVNFSSEPLLELINSTATTGPVPNVCVRSPSSAATSGAPWGRGDAGRLLGVITS
ncbi:flavin reductase [Streptomyces sp. NPDC020794]|uniref:flavin reductase n=1 Tax=unclassified Streptomyces TaxID=2593676 RepID=UPI0036E206B8